MVISLNRCSYRAAIGNRGGSRILEWGHRSSAEGASIEAPQAPIEWGLGRGCPFPNKGVWSGSGQ